MFTRNANNQLIVDKSATKEEIKKERQQLEDALYAEIYKERMDQKSVDYWNECIRALSARLIILEHLI